MFKSFDVAADGYDRLIGRYLPTLAPAFADEAEVAAGMRVLDVGCGPGGLTRELAARVGPQAVSAIDPSASFVEACRARNPGVDVQVGFAEQLPYDDGRFDAALASLVVPFMTDPHAGAREMARVTRTGGVVAMCFWDYSRSDSLGTFWRAAAVIDPDRSPEPHRFGGRQGEIAGLLERAGLADVRESTLVAQSDYTGFDDWWSPFPLGVGPAGAYCAALDDDRREALRSAAYDLLGQPSGGFTMRSYAWCARGTVT
jgi:SAM-dependent methyltransferase